LLWELAYAKGYELQVSNASTGTLHNDRDGRHDTAHNAATAARDEAGGGAGLRVKSSSVTTALEWMTFYNTTSGQGKTEVVSGFGSVTGTDYRVFCYERFVGSPWGFSLYELELFNSAG
jgi:hypothetical protein